MNEFLNVAKNLDIKQIGKNVVNEEEETGGVNDKQTHDEDTSIQSDEIPINDTIILGRTASQVSANDSSTEINDHNKPYKCKLCDYQTTHKGHLNKHVKSIHEGIKYPCHQCDYKARNPSDLNKHVNSKHKGIKYPCQQCHYKATNTSDLKKHVNSKHEGIKYPCQQCDYQATQSGSLQRHIISKHRFDFDCI